ncbi:MAG: ROK family protein [Terrimonas sp.]|uniref:ROK family protein n=1 Tax=Terrimonas sp. TaxID=1914338 RepID=UPI000926AB9C|nr:ROK family protein [Terrimonas sp.]MBN8786607.1 ROK family protein [Terrimonas sp.]OJY95608.1 MAG: glucokinase [Sphingobacteriales bacterium 40-81]PVD52142.1 glucokinase [Terrimonas sp.]
MKQQYAIGIDIGGTNTVFGIVDHRGDTLYRGAISSRKHQNIEDYIQELYEALQPAILQVGGIENIKGIGIGAPNGNYYSGTIEYAPNLIWKGIIPLAKLITEKFGVPAALTNDANAAAVGEMMYGAAKGMKDFIMITLGTGVGSGIVANGHLIYGHDGFAGELGHTTIIPGGRLHPGTNMKGSLESYASATGVAYTAREFLEQRPDQDSLLRNYPLDGIDSRIVYDCAIQGDTIAKEVYEYTGQILGLALSNFVMFSSPEAIILFGGMTKAGDLILKPTQKHMEENLLPIFQNKVKLIFSELKEADAAILGASALVWEIKDRV